ncbi:MAG: choice-of-anchor J domain-containing protein, partial [Anaerolineales bacterium]|nr:choice-of-anchor J domain-containing protein [Anaerolineales bacterium]
SLDPLREVVMNRLAYRNFGDHEVLVGNFVTDIGNNMGGVRWFELRKVGAGAWTLYQEGTYAPTTTDNRWMGAIAMDGSGNIALGYNVSSQTIYPSLRYAGRLESDPLGTLPQGEYTLVNGTAVNGSNRYGDYAAMSVDPEDDCTFWFTGQWNGASSWSTRIGAFKFDACGTADFTLTAAPDTQAICTGTDAIYDVTIGQVQTYADPVTLSISGAPAGTTSDFSVNPVTPPDSSQLMIGSTAGAVAGNYNIEIMGIAPTSTHTTTVGLDVYATPPGASLLQSPAHGATNVSTQPTYTWTGDGDSYTVEVATDPGFTNVVDTAVVNGTSYNSGITLNTSTTYYWRVQAANPCGTGSYSSTYIFTTEAAPGDCGPGTTLNELFSEDFEGGAAGWTHNGTGDTWTLSTARPWAGAYSYYGQDAPSVSDQRLVSPEITLPTGENPLTLQFYNWQTMEDSGSGCYDGGLLEISTDNGSTWTQISTSDLLTDPYDGPVDNGYSNPLAGKDAWCGDPQDWLNSIVDVSDYAGQTVQFRFRLGTDSSVGREGWYLDDVKVQSCQGSGGTPVIDVTPGNMDDTLSPNQVVTHTMTISNTGTADLIWSVSEASDSACANPTDLDWLSISPNAGLTAPGYSAALNVVMNSTGVSAGMHTGALCVSSNDGSNTLVAIPVTLTVEYDAYLYLPFVLKP